MPNMANVTVKKADGTTDVVYTQATPAAGDKSPAVWKNHTVGTTVAQRPTLTIMSADNGTRKARRIRSTYYWPKTRLDSGGNVIIQGGITFEVSALIPQDMTPTEIGEAVAQQANLQASALLKSVYVEGYAPS